MQVDKWYLHPICFNLQRSRVITNACFTVFLPTALAFFAVSFAIPSDIPFSFAADDASAALAIEEASTLDKLLPTSPMVDEEFDRDLSRSDVLLGRRSACFICFNAAGVWKSLDVLMATFGTFAFLKNDWGLIFPSTADTFTLLVPAASRVADFNAVSEFLASTLAIVNIMSDFPIVHILRIHNVS